MLKPATRSHLAIRIHGLLASERLPASLRRRGRGGHALQPGRGRGGGDGTPAALEEFTLEKDVELERKTKKQQHHSFTTIPSSHPRAVFQTQLLSRDSVTSGWICCRPLGLMHDTKSSSRVPWISTDLPSMPDIQLGGYIYRKGRGKDWIEGKQNAILDPKWQPTSELIYVPFNMNVFHNITASLQSPPATHARFSKRSCWVEILWHLDEFVAVPWVWCMTQSLHPGYHQFPQICHMTQSAVTTGGRGRRWIIIIFIFSSL